MIVEPGNNEMCDLDVHNTVRADEEPEDAIDILEGLLEIDQDTGGDNNCVEQIKTATIDISKNGKKPYSSAPRKRHRGESLIHSGDTDSSDDEDNRNCMAPKYNDFGKSVKQVLSEKDNVLQENSCLRDRSAFKKDPVWKSNVLSVEEKISKIATKPVNSASKLVSKPNIDVYTDPVFGLRMINPLVSSQQLKEKMLGRTAVSMAKVKYHIQHGDTGRDWVIGGVIVRKSPVRTSQKGSQYCIWKLSDLREGLKTVSLFLFRNSHKNLWKTSIGTAVGVLNPSVLENRDDKEDEATLSVDNSQKIMILGVSKDFGTCKSRKKNGGNCTAFVNVYKCEFCVFHVKQEYKKCSQRAELQSPGLVGLRNKVLGKNEVFYGGQSFTAIPAKVNRKQLAKDNSVLSRLSEGYKPSPRMETLLNHGFKASPSLVQTSKPAANQLEANRTQAHKDQTRLQSLLFKDDELRQPCVSLAEEKKLVPSFKLSQLGKAGTINLNAPISRFHVDRARMNAVHWVKRNGPFRRENPNDVKAICADGIKRALESDPIEGNDAKKVRKLNLNQTEAAEPGNPVSSPMSRFQQLLEAKSRHTDLLEARDEQSQEEYFINLEKKEKMEEKMLNTFKVECKAVRCLKCKYTAFSASDMCKTLGHPLKVTDSFKRFFSCRDCGNRTVSLELIPLFTCKQCQGSHWQRAPMMRERKGANLNVDVLSIRGGEEKFIGTVHTGGNMNLMVPE